MIKIAALVMSFSVGFLSLSQEILWVRLLGFLSQGAPQILSVVLSCFLLGIAVGAILGKKICSRSDFSILWCSYIWLAIGGIDLVLPEFFPVLMNSDFYMLFFALLVFFTAALKATIFPIAHHLYTTSDATRIGESLSYVYLCNIIGSTLGPLLVGFVLLDFISLFDVFRIVACIGVALAVLFSFILCKPFQKSHAVFYGIAGALLLSSIFIEKSSLSEYLNASQSGPVVFVSENRQGIIHTIEDNSLGDIVYGGNIYDGRLNLSLTKNSNKIDRVFLLSGLHEKPKNVLVIGLSAGAWTKVIAENKNVEKIDVVEINPGYINLAKTNSAVSSILQDPKVSIHIDDGRRWLRNSGLHNHYDLIVMNTTFHWRLYTTNLLSQEMMLLIKSSLAEGGIFAFNATGSKDAHYTAASVFKTSYRWSNFIYSSDHDFIKTPEEIAGKIFQLYPVSTWPYDNLNQESLEKLFAEQKFVSIEEEIAASDRALEVIKDDNMIIEYKYGQGL
jgi:spermidine synthase